MQAKLMKTGPPKKKGWEPEFLFPPEIEGDSFVASHASETIVKHAVPTSSFSEPLSAEELLPPELWFLIFRQCIIRDIVVLARVGIEVLIASALTKFKKACRLFRSLIQQYGPVLRQGIIVDRRSRGIGVLGQQEILHVHIGQKGKP
jgi:hypothetical protein